MPSPPSSVHDEPREAAGKAPEAAMAPAEPAAALSGLKRKEMEPAKKKTTFKGVANLVLAMKRFSNALNPTYSYGKRTTSTSSGGKGVTEEKEAHQPVSSARGAPSPGHPEYAYSDHGHRFDFLLKPLPPTEDEEAEAAAGKIL